MARFFEPSVKGLTPGDGPRAVCHVALSHDRGEAFNEGDPSCDFGVLRDARHTRALGLRALAVAAHTPMPVAAVRAARRGGGHAASSRSRAARVASRGLAHGAAGSASAAPAGACPRSPSRGTRAAASACMRPNGRSRVAPWFSSTGATSGTGRERSRAWMPFSHLSAVCLALWSRCQRSAICCACGAQRFAARAYSGER